MEGQWEGVWQQDLKSETGWEAKLRWDCWGWAIPPWEICLIEGLQAACLIIYYFRPEDVKLDSLLSRRRWESWRRIVFIWFSGTSHTKYMCTWLLSICFSENHSINQVLRRDLDLLGNVGVLSSKWVSSCLACCTEMGTLETSAKLTFRNALIQSRWDR